jgi:low affinity Fe/Cu permease
MKKTKVSAFSRMFANLSARITKIAGSSGAFMSALIIVIVWAATGPIFRYSDTWQLVINTGTTIVTFLMVFLIQQSQNKDTIALHLKLNELIASNHRASNRLVNIEDLTEEELATLKKFYTELACLSKENKDVFATHSIDEAKQNYSEKRKVLVGNKHIKPLEEK